MKIRVNDLKEGMKLRQEVYHSGNILMNKDQVLTEKHIERLKNFSILEVHIESEEEAKMNKIREEEEKIKTEFEEVYKKTLEKTKDVFVKAEKGELDAETVDNVIETTLSSLEKNRDIFLTLLEMKEENNYLYEHSMKSSIIALSIGAKLGYDREKLAVLGKAALLHDVGMFKVDKTVLNKEGKLTSEELDEMRKHTEFGYELLKDQDEEVRLSALYHHERMDGEGYPKGLKGEEIPELVKVVTIADLYSALISERVYRDAKDPKEVIKYLMSVASKQVDTNIVKKLLENMSMFSIGSYVRLSNGLRAKVVKATKNPFRPIVDVEDKGEIFRMDLSEKEHSLVYVMRLIV
jgi:HD-GYP domain-containing protein (c-di-GMP phosphodiesterase class II)